MAAKLSDSKQELSEAGATFSNKPDIQDNLDRLLLMLDYAQKSITSKDLTANGGSEEAKMKATEDAKELISKHPDTGVFLSYYNTSQPAQKPNVVLIVADDLGYGDLSCYGATKISTPAIDQLAAEGMKFQHAYVTSSLCSPSRYSLLTGQYNWRSRLEWGVVKSFEKPLIQENQTTMANLFRRNGYRTLCIGKWHLGLEWEVNNSAPPDPEQSVFNSWATNLQDYIDFSSQIGGGPIERGFDYFYGMAGSNNMQPYVLIENDQVLQPPTEEQKPYDHYVDALRAANWDIKTINQDLTEKAVEAIDYHFTSFPDEPLFFYFPTSAIHRPCLPTFTKGKSKAGLRGDIVVELDWTVNQVVNALKRNGEYENTILVFISDNGPRPGDPALWMEEYQFGEYDDFHESYFDNYQPEYINENGNKIWKKGWYTYDHRASGELLGFKSDSWEGGLKVPFIVRWPNHIKPGSVNTNMVCAVDLLSTFAELLGDELRETEAEDSYSFLSNLLDKNAPQVRKSLVLSGGASGALAVIQDDWKYIQAAPPGRWPETFYPQGPSKSDTQLYNLSEDRQEQQNLYNTEQAKVIELQGLIERIKQKPGIENE
jgi:arylsulfatase A-like enzyme